MNLRCIARRDDAGETLVEILVTLTIMSIAVVVIVGGLGIGFKSSAIVRTNDNAQQAVLSAVGTLTAAPFVPCSTSDTTQPQVQYLQDLGNPVGLTLTVASLVNPTIATATFTSSCAGAGDTNLQLITVTATAVANAGCSGNDPTRQRGCLQFVKTNPSPSSGQ